MVSENCHDMKHIALRWMQEALRWREKHLERWRIDYTLISLLAEENVISFGEKTNKP